MDQTFINWIISLLGVLMVFLINAARSALSSLQARVSALEVLVAREYLPRAEFQKFTEAIFVKLDRIEAKLDNKADKV